MDCIVHGVAKSKTWLRDPHFTLLVCAQCFSMWVTWLGSESSHHFTSILQNCNIPLSLLGFPSRRSSAPDLLHHFPSSSLCSALPLNRAPWRSRSSHIPFTLFHPFLQGWVHMRCLLHVCVAWINIRVFKLPFFWLGSSWACVSPRTGVSQVMCRQWVSSKRTGREQGCKSGPKSYSPHVSWSFMIKWVQVSMERINKHSNRNKRVLLEPSWAL